MGSEMYLGMFDHFTLNFDCPNFHDLFLLCDPCGLSHNKEVDCFRKFTVDKHRLSKMHEIKLSTINNNKTMRQ